MESEELTESRVESEESGGVFFQLEQKMGSKEERTMVSLVRCDLSLSSFNLGDTDEIPGLP